MPKEKGEDSKKFDLEELGELEDKANIILKKALSKQDEYLSLLEDVFEIEDDVDTVVEEDFDKFKLLSKRIDDILLVTCLDKSEGNILFFHQTFESYQSNYDVKFIVTTVSNYIKDQSRDLLEILTLKDRTIHFFSSKNFIVSIVTTTGVSREHLIVLSKTISNLAEIYPEQLVTKNPETWKYVVESIEMVRTSLIKETCLVKIVMGGDGAVGKTSIRKCFLGEDFSDDYQMTIGADFASKESQYIFSGGKKIKFLVWDLAGQPRFDTVRPNYYKQALGAIIVFDVTRPKTFKNVVKWLNELWKNNGRGPIPAIIVANKVDLRKRGTFTVPDQRAKMFVKRLSAMTNKYQNFKLYYVPTSAKSGDNIDLVFTLLGEAILNFFDFRRDLSKDWISNY